MIIPEYISLFDWANSLFVDFPDDFIPLLYNEEDWKEWGKSLIISPSFINNACPDPEDYDDWKVWAYEVYYAMLDQG